MSTAQGRARIEFEADASGVSAELIAKMDATLEKIAATFDKAFAHMEANAQASMGGVGQAAESAGRRADGAASGAAAAFGKVDAAAAKAGASAMDAGQDAATGARRGADAASGLGTAIDRAGDAAGRAAGKMSQVGSTGRAGFDGAAGAASGLIGVIGKVGAALALVAGPMQILKGGWARSTGMHEAEIRFRSMGVEGDSFRGTVSMLNEVVSGTSASLNDAAGQASMLMTSGVDGGQALQESMEALVTSAAVGGRQVGEMGQVFQQVAAAGKLQAGDALQLTSAQVPIWTWLSKYMGKSIEDVRKLSEQGKISYEDMVQAIRSEGGSLAKDMGATFAGQVSMMRSAMARLGEQITTPIMKVGLVVVPAVTKAFDVMGKAGKGMIGWLREGGAAADVFKVALAAIGSAVVVGSIVGLVGKVGLLTKAIGLAKTAWSILNLAFLFSPIGLVVAAIGGLVAGFVILWNRSEAFRSFWIDLWDSVVGKVMGVVDTVKAAWDELTAVFRGGDDGYAALGSLIGDGAAKWFLNTLDTIRIAWGELTTAFRGGDDGYGALSTLISEDAAKWVITLVGNVKGAWEELTTAFQGGDWGYGVLAAIVGEGAAEWAVNAIGAVRDAWEELTTAFSGGDWGYGALSTIFGEGGAEMIINTVATLGEIAQMASDLFTSLRDSAAGFVATLSDSAWETAKSLFSALVDVGRALFDAFREIGAAVWDLFQALSPVLLPVLKVVAGIIGVTLYVAIQGIIGALTLAARVIETLARVAAWLAENVLTPLIGVLGRVASALIDRVAAALTTVVEWVGKTIAFVSDMGSKIIGAFSTAKTWLASAGRNVVQGFLDGIKTLAPKIGEYFLDLLPGWIREPFKKALGIASPSKVFAGYGRNIGEGLIGGLQSMQGRVEGALGGMVNTAVGVGDELREAFTGGDSGYAALGTVIGDDLARTAVNATAGAGQTVATAGIAASEATTAFQGGDDGYGAAASLLGDDAGKAAIDMSAQIGSAFTAAGDGINAVKAGMIDPAVAGLQQQMTDYATNTQTAMSGVVVPAMNAAGAGIATAKASLFDPAYAGMQAAVTTTAATTQSAMLGVALPAMQTAGSGIAAVQTGTVDPALAAMRGAVANTQSAFASGTAGILGEWNKVREGTAAPVRFTISSVFNDGLVGMWNSVSDLLGTSKMNPYPVRFATGGPVRGPGGPTDDKIPALLSNREYVMTAEAVSRIGEDNLNALNYGGVNVAAGAFAADRRQQQQLLADQTFQQIASRYAGGGIVQGSKAWTQLRNGYLWAQSRSGRPYVLGGSAEGGGGTDCSGFMSGIADRIQGGSGRRQWATMAFNGGGNTQQASGPQGFIAGLARGFAIGVTNGGPAGGHTAGTIGGVEGMPAVNVEAGGSPSLVKFGAGAVGADHSQFATRYHLPLGADGAFVSGGSAGVSITQMIAEMTKPYRDKAMAAARDFAGRTPGRIGGLPVHTGDKLLGAADSKIGTLAEAMMTFGGDIDDSAGMVERWRPMMKAALMKQGLADWANNPAIVDRFMKQIAHESSGRPDIFQQIQDINSGGNEAGGLGQIAKGTFAAYRDPSLPNNVLDPWANLNAMARYVRDAKPNQYMDIGNGIGYDQGGIANGMGFLQKKIVDPERVLNPRQTKAFEAWMAAGQRFDEINDLVASVQSMQLDSPEVMADEIGRRVAAWVGDDPADGSLRALAGALQSGVEWERVTAGMQRSAEAWANGDWVRVAEDKRLATPDEMRRQVEGNFLSELADEFGGLIGLKGLYKAPELVGDSGLVTLDKDTLAKLDAAVATPDGATPDVAVPTGVSGAADLANATRITTDTTTGGAGGTTDSGEKVIQVAMTVNVHGANDPMAISRQITRDISRGLETAIGGQVRSQ